MRNIFREERILALKPRMVSRLLFAFLFGPELVL